MFSLARSLDNPLVMAIPAAREMEVGMEAGPGVRPPRLVTLMIRPPPTLRISPMESCISRTAAQTFSSKSDCQSSWLTLSKGLAMDEPALLTIMSTRPKLSTAVLIIFWEAPSVVMSKARGITEPSVAVLISCTAWSSTSWRRATMTTLAPSLAILNAAAFPIPSLPPVMIATLPSRPMSIVISPVS